VAVDVALVAGHVTNAEAVVATVARAGEGDAGVAAVGAPAAETHRATDGLRCLSAPWATTFYSLFET